MLGTHIELVKIFSTKQRKIRFFFPCIFKVFIKKYFIKLSKKKKKTDYDGCEYHFSFNNNRECEKCNSQSPLSVFYYIYMRSIKIKNFKEIMGPTVVFIIIYWQWVTGKKPILKVGSIFFFLFFSHYYKQMIQFKRFVYIIMYYYRIKRERERASENILKKIKIKTQITL